MDTSLGQFEYSDKVMNSTESLFYSSNDTPINISDPGKYIFLIIFITKIIYNICLEYSKSFINTDMNNKNDILALPFNGKLYYFYRHPFINNYNLIILFRHSN